jgi:DNA polymerase-3 subunit delta'
MFADVLGHERLRAALATALAQDRLPPALLLSGPEGVGKRRLALAVAAALVCETPTPDGACGQCNPCRRLARGITIQPEQRAAADEATKADPLRYNFTLHPDVLLVEPSRSGKSVSLKVDQVRAVVDQVAARPFESRARAFIVDDAHLMNEQAQNAFLKSLEEPPRTSHLMLVTPWPQALLPTIRSRCQELRFGSLPLQIVERQLQSELQIGPDEARLRAVLSGGSLGEALTLDTEAYAALREDLLQLLAAAERATVMDRMDLADQVNALADAPAALTVLRGLLRDLGAIAAGGGASQLINADVGDRLAALAAGPLGARATALAQAVGDTRDVLLGRIPGTSLMQGAAHKLLALDVLMDALTIA